MTISWTDVLDEIGCAQMDNVGVITGTLLAVYGRQGAKDAFAALVEALARNLERQGQTVKP
jgi:hypothetical protein